MRSTALCLLCDMVLFLLVAGCGGGGSPTRPPTPVSITTSSLTQGTTNSVYTAVLAATGGSGTYTWSLASGSSLPAGLSLSSGGVISAHPPPRVSPVLRLMCRIRRRRHSRLAPL